MPRPHVSGYYLIRSYFFADSKFPCPHVSVFKSNLPVHTYPTRILIHSSTQDSSGNIGNRACVVKRAILLRHRIRKYPDLVSTFIAYSISSTLESGFKKLRIHMPNSQDTCGRKPNPQRKSCGFKNIT